MSYDAETTLRKNEQRPIYGSASAASGTLTVSGTPTFTLYSAAGVVITGYNGISVTGSTSGAAAEVDCWQTLDGSDANIPAGTYSAIFAMNASASSDSIIRHYRIEVLIVVLPATDVAAGEPTLADLKSYLATMGLTYAGVGLQAALQGTLRKWREVTKYLPFVAETVDSTTYYTPYHSLLLDLRGGYVSVTSVTRSIYTSYAGALLVENQDYWLEPLDYAALSRPVTAIRFRVYPYGDPRSIAVVGKRGFCTAANFPPNAFLAIVQEAARKVLPAIMLATSGGALDLIQGPVAWKGIGGKSSGFATAGEDFSKEFLAEAMTFRRLF